MTFFTSSRRRSRWGFQATMTGMLIAMACVVAQPMLPAEMATTRTSTIWVAAAALMLSLTVLVGMRRLVRRRLDAAERAARVKLQLLQRDELTDALARRFFLDGLRNRLRHPAATPHCLLLVDLDHFKSLNDAFGHKVGDLALVHLVQLAHAVFPAALVGRLGGDEFAILVESPADEAFFQNVQLFLSRLREPCVMSGRQLRLSASLGVACFPEHSTSAEELRALADLALYESKNAGRGRLTMFDTEMLRHQRQRRFIERELRAAILLDQLAVQYQPILDIDQKVVAVEALVRWNHPIRGWIPPGEFVPIAEESTLIDLLGEWVMRRVCLDASQFGGIMIAINVSAAQLRRDDVVSTLRAVIDETGVDCSRLCIEITETFAGSASAEVIQRIKAIREMGLRVSLDDFGTGNCGFSYLQRLPIDLIKIDRSYIQQMQSDELSRALTTALAQIGRAIDLRVLAEGVETEEHFALARAAGCTLFQGFHFSRPGNVEDIAPLVRGLPVRGPAAFSTANL
ncbi:EAL domain-containing protein [Aurantimonas sp. MSK8Z-1]|uniref:putative bifunctional diguanylate cyclase/phosphodiesterase n=1 Tax=Mangrovibrevibacter kandeliae TaxID=2968473 RepID=UPI002119A7AB|nr:EAL domain-containing protein [Aurantimonas sp. MSK8Z-1]MCW4114900.1 EAL domain-containing protein [Aurantimonas sp. MSK8Z-1]